MRFYDFFTFFRHAGSSANCEFPQSSKKGRPAAEDVPSFWYERIDGFKRSALSPPPRAKECRVIDSAVHPVPDFFNLISHFSQQVKPLTGLRFSRDKRFRCQVPDHHTDKRR